MIDCAEKEIEVPTGISTADWLVATECKYGDKNVLKPEAFQWAKSAFGTVRFRLDGDVVVTTADFTLLPDVAETLSRLSEVVCMGFFADLAASLICFQAFATRAGGFVVTEEGNIGCRNESALTTLVNEEIGRMHRLASVVGFTAGQRLKRECDLQSAFLGKFD